MISEELSPRPLTRHILQQLLDLSRQRLPCTVATAILVAASARTLSIASLAFMPRGVLFATAARSISPVAKWHRQYSSLMIGDCVPLPHPGGPANSKTASRFEIKFLSSRCVNPILTDLGNILSELLKQEVRSLRVKSLLLIRKYASKLRLTTLAMHHRNPLASC